MKFCKDCKHYRPNQSMAFYGGGVAFPARCFAPALMEVDPVDGLMIHKIGAKREPRDQRAAGEPCGPDAALFEAKPPAEVPATPVQRIDTAPTSAAPRQSIWQALFGPRT